MEEIPFVAFGNNEISTMPPVGETISCKRCKKKHKITYGTTDGKENRMLGFVKCGKATYLATIEGREIK